MPGLNRRVAAATLAVMAALQAALFFYYLRVNLVLQPYWDMYSHLTRYLRFRGDGNWGAYLWEPHVQHRHLWMRLLTAFDVEALGGTGYPFVVSAVACLMLTTWLLWREIARGAPRAIAWGAGCLAIMLTLTAVAAVDSATPINAIYPHVLMFSVLAVVLFTAPDRDLADGALLFWRRSAGVLAAIAAAFANTMALALWPILAWLAWREGDRRWLAAVAVIGGMFTVTYVNGLPFTDQPAASRDLIAKADYLMAYIGLPWTRAAALAIPGRIAGLALTLVAVAALFMHLRAPALDRMQRIAVGLIALSLASAVLAAAGRAGVSGDVVVPIRYAVLLTPLHVGLLMLALPRLAAFERQAINGAIALAALLLVQQIAAGEAARTATRAMRETLQRFAAGETDEKMKAVVFDNLEQAREQLNAIQAAGLYRDAR